MVGGDSGALERARPLLECLGQTIVHQGGPGSGQHTKMANQIAVASTTLAVVEALAYARRAGLDPDLVLESIGSGAAGSWAMSRLFPRAAAADFAPGFALKHFAKDLRIADGEQAVEGLILGGMEHVRELLRRMEELGLGELGTQALILAVERGTPEPEES
jgi:3-hydroxyisobutyrate dehydrogenase